MPEAYIVDAARNGPSAAGAEVASPIRIRPTWPRTSSRPSPAGTTSTPPTSTTSSLGCLDNIGSQAGTSPARPLWRRTARESVPGVTIDRQCGSAQQAVSFAAQAVMSGTSDIIVAGGVQKMSQYRSCRRSAPVSRSVRPTLDRLQKAGSNATATRRSLQFRGAEMIADQWGLSREGQRALRPRKPPAHCMRSINGYTSKGDHRSSRASPPTKGRAATPQPKARRPEDADPRRCADRWCGQPDLRRRGRAAGRLRAAVERYGFTPHARVHHISARGADPVDAVGTDSAMTSTRSSAPDCRSRISTPSRSTRHSHRLHSPGSPRSARTRRRSIRTAALSPWAIPSAAPAPG